MSEVMSAFLRQYRGQVTDRVIVVVVAVAVAVAVAVGSAAGHRDTLRRLRCSRLHLRAALPAAVRLVNSGCGFPALLTGCVRLAATTVALGSSTRLRYSTGWLLAQLRYLPTHSLTLVSMLT